MSMSTPVETVGSQPSATDAYEAKIRWKMAEEGNHPCRFSLPEDNDNAQAAFEERLKRKLATSGINPQSSNHRPKYLSSSMTSAKEAAESYEIKIRRKLARERKGNSNRPKHLSSSMPDFDLEELRRKHNLTSSLTSAGNNESYEDKIKRKLQKEASRRNNRVHLASSLTSTDSAGSKSYEEKIMRKLQRGASRRNNVLSHLSSSMPNNALGGSKYMSDYEEKIRQKSMEQASSDGKFSKLHGYKIEDDGPVVETIQQDSLFGVSTVCFDNLFDELQRFMQQQNNGDSLTMSVSHPAFLRIVDTLASLGMENLLKKRWDYQFAGVKAFKREHGDVLIPPSHPTLGKWVGTQQDHYKTYEERLPSPMTQKRYKKLKGVGFDEYVSWKGAGSSKSSQNAKIIDAKENSRRRKETILKAKAEAMMYDTLTFEESLPEEEEKGVSNNNRDGNGQEVASTPKGRHDTRDSSGSATNSPGNSTSKGKHNNNVHDNAGSPTINSLTFDQKLQLKKMASTKNFVSGDSITSDDLTLDQKIQLKKMASSRTGVSESGRASADDEHTLSLDQKLQLKKASNNRKFLERGLKAHGSSSLSKSTHLDKEAVAAELQKKRTLQRSMRRGMSRRMLSKMLMEPPEEDGKRSDDADADAGKTGNGGKSREKYFYMRRSSSASNLCAGSWECTKCSHINEPIGFNEGTACKVCNAHKDKKQNLQEEGNKNVTLEKNDVVPRQISIPNLPKDDIDVSSWSELDDALAVATSRSIRHLNNTSTQNDYNVDSWSELDGVLAMAVTKSIRVFDQRHSIMEEDEEEE